MPQNPSVWAANYPVTAKQLNQDLYTYSYGNNHKPNGILFHALPPLIMLSESTALSATSSAGGASTALTSANFWRAAIDNSCYFGPGGDFMGSQAAGHFLPTVPGSAGFLSGVAQTGGWYLTWGVCAIAHTTNAQGFGAQLWNNGSTAAIGGVQLSSTTRDNAEYVFDLQQITPPANTNLGSYVVDSSAASYNTAVTFADYTGETTQLGALWSAPLPANSPTVPSSLPVPTTGYTGASAITSAGLNGNGLAAPLAFLNNPPQVRVSFGSTTSIPNNGVLTPTLVGLTGGVSLDNWSGFSTGTSLYTVPVSGVYLVHAVVNYTANVAGQRQCGIQTNGTLTLWGPSYTATGAGVCRPQVLRLLDLNAGDTVGVVTGQNSGGAVLLSNSFSSRLVVRFMAAQGASNGGTTWTAPDTSYRWQAGNPASNMAALFQAHLANDLSFLIQRPYLLAYQTTQQVGLSNAAFSVITMDQLKGRVHATAGDNYGGWTSGASNRYAAVVPGWYLCVLSVTQTFPSASPAHCLAGIGYFTSGSAAQGSSAVQWGQHVRTTSAGFSPGAEAIGLFYLRAGDFVQPQYQQQDGGATYSTSVAVGQESLFGCVWVSE